MLHKLCNLNISLYYIPTLIFVLSYTNFDSITNEEFQEMPTFIERNEAYNVLLEADRKYLYSGTVGTVKCATYHVLRGSPLKQITFLISMIILRIERSQWRHNERDWVSNHWCIDCLLNHFFWHRSKKTSKLFITGLCEENPPVTSEFLSQRASNSENVSIWWRHDK